MNLQDIREYHYKFEMLPMEKRREIVVELHLKFIEPSSALGVFNYIRETSKKYKLFELTREAYKKYENERRLNAEKENTGSI